MAEKPFSERVIQLGEERLDSYTKRILDFLDTIEAEMPETFIPFLAEMAVVHAVKSSWSSSTTSTWRRR